MFPTKQNFKKITLLFVFILLCLFSQHSYCQNTYNKEQIDSIAKYKKQNLRNLIKLHYSLVRFNTPWIVPNGLCYERIWGKKTTYGTGVIFRSRTTSPDDWDILGYAEARYYLHRQKNNHTFKGFFFQGGLMYWYRSTTIFKKDITCITAGFGYQTMIYKNLSFEAGLSMDVGGWHTDNNIAFPTLSYNKFDAFQWGDIGLRFGYRF